MSAWTLDTAHANVEFSVKHMMITTIRGRFQQFEVEVDSDEQVPERSAVVARIVAASLTTNQEPRRPPQERGFLGRRDVPRASVQEHGHPEGKRQ